MSHGSPAAAIDKAVCAITMEQIVDHLHGYPNTKNANHFEEQLAKACVSVHITAWRGQHVCLPLALSESALARTTNSVLTSSKLPLPN